MGFWSFRFQGGDSFLLQVPWNPIVEHDGQLTIAHLFVDEQVADTIAKFAEQHDCRVLRHTDGQTEEQAAERRALLGDKEAVFLCSACPECFWFDPKLTEHNFCGVEGWSEEFKRAGLHVQEKARRDLLGCPVRDR